MKNISEEQLQQKWLEKVEAVLERADLSEDEKNVMISEIVEGYKRESFEAFARRAAAALYSHKKTKDDEDEARFVEDYIKVATAHYHATPGKEREALEKVLKEIWEQRRREKAAWQQEEGKSKK